MTTILIKKKDTAGAPAPGDLTNSAGGTEIAVNTATRRIYTKDSGGNVVELGNNATSSTIADLTVTTSTTLSYGTANQVQYLNGSKLLVGSANMTFNGTTLTVAGFSNTGNEIIGTNTSNTLVVNSLVNSSLLFTDNTYDIGASGATRPRTLYLGTSLVTPSITNSGLTSGRVVYTTTGGLETTSSNLTFDGTSLYVGGTGMNNAFGVKGGYMEVYQATNAVSSGYGYRFYSDGGATHSLIAGINGLQETLGSSAGQLVFQTNNGTSITDRMWLTSTGRLGIGISAPLNQLHTYVASGSSQLTVQSGSAYTYFGYDGSTYVTIGTNQGATGTKFAIDKNAPDNSLVVNSGGIFGFRQTPSLANGSILRVQNDGTYNAGLSLYNNAGTLGSRFTLENFTTSTDSAIYSTGYFDVYTAGDSTNPTLYASGRTVAIDVSSNPAITYNGTTFTPTLRVGNARANYGGLAINPATSTNCPQIWCGYGVGATTQTMVFDDNSNLIIGLSSFLSRGTTSYSLYVKNSIGIGTTSLDGVFSLGGATTGNIYQTTKNSNGSLLMGVESSAGGTLVGGGSAYASVINQQNNYPLQLGANNTVMLSLNKTANFVEAANNVILRTNDGGYFYSFSRYTNTSNYGTILFQNGTGYNMVLGEVGTSVWALGCYVTGGPNSAIMDVRPIRWNANGYVALGNYYSDALATSSGATVNCYSGYSTGTNATVGSVCRGGALTSAYISASNPGFDWQFGKSAQTGTTTSFEWGTSGGGGTVLMSLTSGGNLTVYGSLSKGSGSFVIDHPLPAMEETHHLVHSFIEGPQADLIYRGRVNLVNGRAEVNIDTASSMTDGTFVLLCRDVQCYTSNESDWIHVRGFVTGNILTIEAQDPTATSSISWMVIGERQDKHMIDTEWTDNTGKIIVEPTKASREYDPTKDPLNPACPDYDLNAAIKVKPWLKK